MGGKSVSEDNKAVVRKYLEAYNTGNLSVVDETYAPEILKHWVYYGAADERGLDAKKATATRLRTAFPDDLQLTADAMIAEGDLVALRWTLTGTHRGGYETPFGTLPSTGNSVTRQGITIFRLSQGKIVEEWSCSDRVGAWQQMGGPEPSELIAETVRE